MGATKNLFNEHREIWMQDIRDQGNYPPFDHEYNFCKKVKENWLTTQEFTALKSADYIELTIALNRKMDVEYREKIMQWIDKLEPFYIKEPKYISIVCESPLDNMERVFNKYTKDDTYNMRKTNLMYLESEIKKKQNEK